MEYLNNLDKLRFREKVKEDSPSIQCQGSRLQRNSFPSPEL